MEGEEKAKMGPLKPSNVKGADRVLQRRLRKNRAVGEGRVMATGVCVIKATKAEATKRKEKARCGGRSLEDSKIKRA